MKAYLEVIDTLVQHIQVGNDAPFTGSVVRPHQGDQPTKKVSFMINKISFRMKILSFKPLKLSYNNVKQKRGSKSYLMINSIIIS